MLTVEMKRKINEALEDRDLKKLWELYASCPLNNRQEMGRMVKFSTGKTVTELLGDRHGYRFLCKCGKVYKNATAVGECPDCGSKSKMIWQSCGECGKYDFISRDGKGLCSDCVHKIEGREKREYKCKNGHVFEAWGGTGVKCPACASTTHVYKQPCVKCGDIGHYHYKSRKCKKCAKEDKNVCRIGSKPVEVKHPDWVEDIKDEKVKTAVIATYVVNEELARELAKLDNYSQVTEYRNEWERKRGHDDIDAYVDFIVWVFNPENLDDRGECVIP